MIVSTPSSTPVLIVPCDPRAPHELDAAARCLVSLWGTAQGAEVVVVGDRAADPSVTAQLIAVAGELGMHFDQAALQASLAGINPFLFAARDAGRDAIVVASDVEMASADWIDALAARRDSQGRPAAIVGGRLLYPNGLIEHAGLQFSLLEYRFVERFRFGPASLRESRMAVQCPVGPGLVLMRNEVLRELNGLDPELVGHEVVDLCLRAFAAGLECVYEPAAIGTRHRALPQPEDDVQRLRRIRRELVLVERHQTLVPLFAAKVTA
jgi:hypothetical protein